MHRWWEEIDDDLKQDTISLVNNGQFQLNLGGWCMNDEASPTASAVIHQMTDGNQFILSNLGMKGRPTVAWHVDPFGHSWVTGGMWAQSGFDAFGVHRINYLDLEKRKNAQVQPIHSPFSCDIANMPLLHILFTNVINAWIYMV